MKPNVKKLIFCFLTWISVPSILHASNEPSDLMRSNGMIYVVLGVLVIIFSGMIIYLILQDRKLTKLEKQINQKQ